MIFDSAVFLHKDSHYLLFTIKSGISAIEKYIKIEALNHIKQTKL